MCVAEPGAAEAGARPSPGRWAKRPGGRGRGRPPGPPALPDRPEAARSTLPSDRDRRDRQGAVAEEDAGAGAEGAARGQDVVDEDDPGAVEPARPGHRVE